MPYFTSIIYEVLISGSWVDLSADVLQDPAATFSRGISGNEIEDRVADPGRLKFSLNNSESNSAGLLGYYSPGHASCMAGWTTSLPVRLRFLYDGWDIVKWRGRVEPDGIQVIPGTHDARRVDVTCVDFMGLASRHKINLLTLETDKYLYQGVNTVLGNMPIRPAETAYADESAIGTMSVIFDYSNTETTAISEFQKLAASQRFGIVVRGGGNYGEALATHYTRSSTAYEATIPLTTAQSTSYLLMEDGSHILAEDGSYILLDERTTAVVNGSDLQPGTEILYGRHIMNYLTVVTYPRETDAAATTVLWELEQAEKIAAGASLTIRGSYTDPTGGAKMNGTAFVNPVSGTDYKANANATGTGADLTASLSIVATFGAAEVDLVMTNTGATDLYVGGGTAGAFLQVRGKGIRVYDPVREVFSDTGSINTHGVHPYNIEMKYAKDATESSGWLVSRAGFGGITVKACKDPYMSVEKAALVANRDDTNMALFLFTEPLNQIQFTETVSGLADTKANVQGYEATIQPGGIVTWSVVTKLPAI